jgi:SAM-dependent methyltransferase
MQVVRRNHSHVYGADFYEWFREGSTRSAMVVVPIVLELLGPVRTVLDVGCGVGAWLSVFEALGVQDIYGIDRDPPLDALTIPRDRFQQVDLRTPFDLGRVFDLVVCLEVAEHLPEDCSGHLVRSLARHGDAVLFSAAIPGQRGEDHINLQWLSYWSERFRAAGFRLFDLVRPKCWSDSRVEVWYRQNVVLFGRAQAASVLARAPVAGGMVDVVHPETWHERLQPRLRSALAEIPRAARRTARRRITANG